MGFCEHGDPLVYEKVGISWLTEQQSASQQGLFIYLITYSITEPKEFECFSGVRVQPITPSLANAG